MCDCVYLESWEHEHISHRRCECIVVENGICIAKQKQSNQKVHNESVQAWFPFWQKIVVSNELEQRSNVFVKARMKAIECVHFEWQLLIY